MDSESVIQPSWYEKLGEWDKALVIYEEKLAEDSENFELALGRMRCLDSLGKWPELHDLVQGAWDAATVDQRQATACLACSAAVGVGEWEALKTYLVCRDCPFCSLSLFLTCCLAFSRPSSLAMSMGRSMAACWPSSRKTLVPLVLRCHVAIR